VSSVGHAQPPGFRTRGRVRRRVRFLRKARELAYRDLGGLVFNLHRFGQRNDPLVLAKLGTLTHIDSELRSMETALSEHQPMTVMREAGIAACPRCAAIHSDEDRFCPNCGLPMDRHVDLPIAGTPASSPAPSATGVAGGPDSAHRAPTPSDGHTGGTPSPSPSPVPEPTPAPNPVAGAPAVPEETPAPAGGSPVGPPVSDPANPPVPARAPVQTPPSGEEPTEIIRPPTAGA
jgi:hypothetical protein